MNGKQPSTPVGEMLMYYRVAHAISREELAKRIGVSTSTVSNVEAGLSKLGNKSLALVIAWMTREAHDYELV